MRHFRFRAVFVCVLILLFTPLHHTVFAQGETNSDIEEFNSLSPEEIKEIDQFRKSLQDAVVRADARVQSLMKQAARTDIAPAYINKMQLEHAITVLETKKILAAKFFNAPSIKSKRVRAAVLKVMNKVDISAGDLSWLQAVVDEEKVSLKNQES